MKGKKELGILLVSLGLFIFDLVSDFYVAVQYKRAGENGWFGLTLTLIIVPFFVVNIVATCQMKGRVHSDVQVAGFICCFIVLARFAEEFKQWKRVYLDNCPCEGDEKDCNCTACKKHREAISESKKSAYQFVWVQYIETFTESIPQWCLQVYIMLKKRSFPWYTVLSASLSLFSLAWSNTALEKARLAKDGLDLSKMAIVLHFVSQLLVLTPRLFAITISAYVNGSDVFVYLLFFWAYGSVLLGCVTCRYTIRGDTACCDRSIKTLCWRLILSLVLTFYVSEAVLEALGFSSAFIKIFFFITKSAETGYMISLGLYSGELPYLSVLEPFGWTLYGVEVFFGVVLLVVRRNLKRREDAEVPIDDANNLNCQTNDFDEPHSAPVSATNKALEV